MAGYIFTIGSTEYIDEFYKKDPKTGKCQKGSATEAEAHALSREKSLKICIERGVYSARIKKESIDKTDRSFRGILADYLGMKAGDDIFFFADRKIYGVGKLINIAGKDCRFRIQPKESSNINTPLTDETSPEEHPFICTFEASHIYKTGVDMDEILMLSTEKIKALRFFSGASFLKVDDVESEEIKNIIARKNENSKSYYNYSENTHNEMAKKLLDNEDAYQLSVYDYNAFNRNGKVKTEDYVEGALLDLLRKDDKSSLGKWDFACRQYIASPPKPYDYADRMDIFGYRYVPGFPTAISKYMVIEIKKDSIVLKNVEQTMKYVDWISRTYTNGDYSMIEAYTIGYDVDPQLEKTDAFKNIITRTYTLAGRDTTSETWRNLRILSYVDLLGRLQKN